MRIDQPISSQIATTKLVRARLKSGTGFHLEIGGEKDHDEAWNYWAKESFVRVDLLRPMPHDAELRLQLAFPDRMSARDVPPGIFDSGTFVEELTCDVGLLFSMLSAPHATIEVKRSKGDQLARITLAIGTRYASELQLPWSELKPFLSKT